MRRHALENRSAMVSMVVLPCELGRSVMKSMAIWDQGRRGVGSGFSRVAGRFGCVAILYELGCVSEY